MDVFSHPRPVVRPEARQRRTTTSSSQSLHQVGKTIVGLLPQIEILDHDGDHFWMGRQKPAAVAFNQQLPYYVLFVKVQNISVHSINFCHQLIM